MDWTTHPAEARLLLVGPWDPTSPSSQWNPCPAVQVPFLQITEMEATFCSLWCSQSPPSRSRGIPGRRSPRNLFWRARNVWLVPQKPKTHSVRHERQSLQERRCASPRQKRGWSATWVSSGGLGGGLALVHTVIPRDQMSVGGPHLRFSCASGLLNTAALIACPSSSGSAFGLNGCTSPQSPKATLLKRFPSLPWLIKTLSGLTSVLH